MNAIRLISVDEYLALPATAFRPVHIALSEEAEECLRRAGIPKQLILTLDDMRFFVASADRRALKAQRNQSEETEK